MADTNSAPQVLDVVLRKYGKIWIWSILSAAVAAFSVRSLSGGGIIQLSAITSFGGNLRANSSSAVLTLLVLIPSVCTLVSVYCLLEFLRYHILPILFPETPAAPEPVPDLQPESQSFTLTGEPIVDYAATRPAPLEASSAPPDGAQLLYRAFAAIVVAMALELVEVLLFAIYRALA